MYAYCIEGDGFTSSPLSSIYKGIHTSVRLHRDPSHLKEEGTKMGGTL